MMKDHYDFYRDNLINDQVGFEPMFSEPHSAHISSQAKGSGSEDYLREHA